MLSRLAYLFALVSLCFTVQIAQAAFTTYDDFNTDGTVDSLKWGSFYNPLPTASGGTVTFTEAGIRSLTDFPIGTTLRVVVASLTSGNGIVGTNSNPPPGGAAIDAMYARNDGGDAFYVDGAFQSVASSLTAPATYDFVYGATTLRILRDNVQVASLPRPLAFADNLRFELGEGNGDAGDGLSLVVDEVLYQSPTTTNKGISLNFGSIGGSSSVGPNVAGAVPLGNWNDIPIAQQTDRVLTDSDGANTSLTLSTAQDFVFPTSTYDAITATFPGEGDNATMRSTIYLGPAGTDLDLTFEGGIPYSAFDIYVYYNGDVDDNAVTFSILDSLGGSLGLSQVGLEDNDAGINGAYVQSTGASVAGNYVRFAGLTSAQVPTDFIIRASGGTATFNYFNGIQIVEVPEPSGLCIAAIGIAGVLGAARRVRRRSIL
jgi:hypothetical protein